MPWEIERHPTRYAGAVLMCPAVSVPELLEMQPDAFSMPLWMLCGERDTAYAAPYGSSCTTSYDGSIHIVMLTNVHRQYHIAFNKELQSDPVRDVYGHRVKVRKRACQLMQPQ